MKQDKKHSKEEYGCLVLFFVVWLTFFFIIPSGPSDTIESAYSVDSSCWGTYFPLNTLTDTVCKNYTLTINDDYIVEALTDKSGKKIEHLKSEFLKVYDVYTFKTGQQYEVFCLDERGRIIKFIVDRFCGSNGLKFISKSFEITRKPNENIEDLNYRELYSTSFTNDTANFNKNKSESVVSISKY